MTHSAQPKMILIGGFLGAGKTTLIAAAATKLRTRGSKVGVVTNDQSGDLVDTQLLRARGLPVAEVAGGCFCCRFDDMLAAAGAIARDARPDVILAEPVGSCTDLSATVLQPLKKLHGAEMEISPYSVVVDAPALAMAGGGGRKDRFPDSVAYIFERQIAEADCLVLNKMDRLDARASLALDQWRGDHFPDRPSFPVSAVADTGIDAWLDFVLSGAPAGSRVVDVDYDLYAEGEAQLGWLNAVVDLRARTPSDWSAYARNVLSRLQIACNAQRDEIAHAKLFVSGRNATLTANLTGSADLPRVTGSIDDSIAQARMFLNARVATPPDRLERRFREALLDDAVEPNIASLSCFQPARPTPQHRFAEVV